MTFAYADSLLSLFAQVKNKGADDGGALAGLMACFGTFAVIMVVLGVVGIVIGWKIFSKAGRPGWESIVPIYSQWILVTEIAKKEPLWFILSIVPFVNIVAAWVICQEIAKKFGKSEMFGIGLFFLGPICWAILAFGSARYQSGKSKPKKRYEEEEEFEEEEDEDEDDRPRRRRR